MIHALEALEQSIDAAMNVTVPLIAAMAEIIGLLIIVTSLLRTAWHYMRVLLFHADYDYHLEMSTGLITALEFLMAAEVSKTILLPTLESVVLLVATFGSRALMSILLRVEMRSERAERAEAKRDEHRAGRRAQQQAARQRFRYAAAAKRKPPGQQPPSS